MSERHAVGRAADVPEGGRIIVDVNGRSIGVFRVDGVFYALLNRCPHQGAELCRGHLSGSLESTRPGEYRFDRSRKLLVCPWHGWEFDLETGRSYCDPLRSRVRAYPVRVERGDVLASPRGQGAPPADATVIEEPGAGAGLAARIEGPYRAETFPIVLEDEYIVVTMRSERDPVTPVTREEPG